MRTSRVILVLALALISTPTLAIYTYIPMQLPGDPDPISPDSIYVN